LSWQRDRGAKNEGNCVVPEGTSVTFRVLEAAARGVSKWHTTLRRNATGVTRERAKTLEKKKGGQKKTARKLKPS